MPAEAGLLLVVDDEPMNRNMLSIQLRKFGFQVMEAEDGRQALALIAEHRFDLVLLDILMPVLGGLETLDGIRQNHPATELPVIMATVKDLGSDVVKALQRGANDYITKPFDFPVVIARVQTQVSLKRAVDRIVGLERSLEQRNHALEEANSLLELANRRMKLDLEAAARIQKAMLPDRLPTILGTNFDWRFEPCTELAGDLLNILPLDDAHVGVYVLDVSGHGAAAALLSVTANGVISRMLPRSSRQGQDAAGAPANLLSPAAVAARLNEAFPWDSRTQQFFTMLYGILSLESLEFRYVSAGHPGPIHLTRGAPPEILQARGFPISVADSAYKESSVTLKPGDRLYLHSDGVSEALSETGRQFGKARLLEALHLGRGDPLSDSLTAVMRTIDEWRGAAPPHDDISILAIEIDERA